MSQENLLFRKKFITSIDEHIKILKNRNLSIPNIKKFKWYITSYNYYNFVNGYNDLLFVNQDRSTNLYKKNTSSEDIIEIFNFDRTISGYILSSILSFERILSSYITIILGQFLCKQSERRNPLNLYGEIFNIDIKHRKFIFSNYKKYSDTEIKNIFSKNYVRNNKKVLIEKYHNKIENVPIWVLSVYWNFGDVKKIIEYLNNFLQDQLIELIQKNLKIQLNREMFIALITMLTKIRNRCAHNNVIYNFSYMNDEVKSFISKNSLISSNKINIFNLVQILDKLLRRNGKNLLEDLILKNLEKLINNNNESKCMNLEIYTLLKQKIGIK